MKYQIKKANGYGMATDSKLCLPTAEILIDQYKQGYALWKDGKKLSKPDALKELPNDRKS